MAQQNLFDAAARRQGFPCASRKRGDHLHAISTYADFGGDWPVSLTNHGEFMT